MATTTYFDLEQAMVARVKDNWTSTDVQSPNEDYSPENAAAWLSISNRPADAYRLIIGPSQYKGIMLRGLFIGNIYVKPNTGAGLALQYADDFRDLFEEVQLIVGGGELELMVARPREIGPTVINNIQWWLLMIEIPWRYLTP